jgi:hypothetical protein
MRANIFAVFLFLFLSAAGALAQTPNYSTHIFHEFPASGQYSDTTIYSTWLTVPTNTSIYAAYQFGFEAGSVGYMGTQVFNTGEHKAVFSVWDADNNPQTSQPNETWCNRFDHEGLGSQCIIDYPWIKDREYKLEARVRSTASDSVVWEASITDAVTGAKTLIGSHKLSNIGAFSGFGSLRNNILTFHEYFAQHTEDCTLRNYSKFKWRGPYVNGETLLSTKAQTNYSDCTLANITSPVKGTTISEMGVGTVKSNANHTILWDADIPAVTPGPACREGDANGDGEVDVIDFATWKRQYRKIVR